MQKVSTCYTLMGMAKARAVTQLELIPVHVMGEAGWLRVSWKRADGSRDDVVVKCRLDARTGRWRVSALLALQPTSRSLREVPLARIEDAINAAGAEIKEWLEQSVDRDILELADKFARVRAKRHRLKRPAKRQLNDIFFERVAMAYRDAVFAGLPPAKTLADDSGTPQGTVNRWISIAREKGMLPEAEPGRVSA